MKFRAPSPKKAANAISGSFFISSRANIAASIAAGMKLTTTDMNADVRGCIPRIPIRANIAELPNPIAARNANAMGSI